MDNNKLETPQHYQNQLGFDLIDLAHSVNMDFTTFNALKYILRAGKKQGESEEKDLKKALHYLHRAKNKRRNPKYPDVDRVFWHYDILDGCALMIFKGLNIQSELMQRIENRLKQLENEANTKE